MPNPNIKPGDSKVQRDAHEHIRKELESRIGLKSGYLDKKRFPINDSYLEVEGYSRNPNIICQFYARIGDMKSAQVHKVMNDALKLIFIEDYEGKTFRKILAFIDDKAAKKFVGNGWHGECLRKYGIEVFVVDISEHVKREII